MGRRPRLLIEGGIYHVYNRVSRGEHIFRDEAEAEKLLKRLFDTKRRDGFQVLAWCVMSNHYHLALRMGEVPLSRSMQTLNHRFTQSFNGRHRLFGPFWHGRYRSKLVEDDDYLQQLIVYIHRNPVTAGVVKDPADYRWSGHAEVLRGGRGRGLVDVDETLAAFEPTRRAALAHYRRAMAAAEGEEWMGGGPGRLPWWRLGRPSRKDADELGLDRERPLIGMDGLSTSEPRPPVELEELLRCGAGSLGLAFEDLRSTQRSPAVVAAREALAWVAVVRYGFQVKEVARGLEKYVETASRLVSRAAAKRVEDEEFRATVRLVEAAVIERFGDQ
ncbi:MAG TPA: transposase [Thermoanaerobaculales bacterium]|nr:transposase [Thermoanaerobaculales bacterium]HPA80310.1 transposase [Thermoanaerobaculales bacterium]HQL29497.1 transposase [Thermoanaerobaculales bacterium]HQN95140.1 transposase [Thermoanaerobaculales bacterium]HQP43195.1 transposase [Thermoanaerobaculales bacterium]